MYPPGDRGQVPTRSYQGYVLFTQRQTVGRDVPRRPPRLMVVSADFKPPAYDSFNAAATGAVSWGGEGEEVSRELRRGPTIITTGFTLPQTLRKKRSVVMSPQSHREPV